VIELLPVVFGKVDELAQGDDRGAYLRRKAAGRIQPERAPVEDTRQCTGLRGSFERIVGPARSNMP
jgi:hypothetical protein